MKLNSRPRDPSLVLAITQSVTSVANLFLASTSEAFTAWLVSLILALLFIAAAHRERYLRHLNDDNEAAAQLRLWEKTSTLTPHHPDSIKFKFLEAPAMCLPLGITAGIALFRILLADTWWERIAWGTVTLSAGMHYYALRLRQALRVHLAFSYFNALNVIGLCRMHQFRSNAHNN